MEYFECLLDAVKNAIDSVEEASILEMKENSNHIANGEFEKGKLFGIGIMLKAIKNELELWPFEDDLDIIKFLGLDADLEKIYWGLTKK